MLRPAPQFRMVKKNESLSQHSVKSAPSQDVEETTPMKQMVAGPCLTMQEISQSKKRMFKDLTGGEDESEILVSKYFKRPGSPSDQLVDLRGAKAQAGVTSESWHVKRDDQKYQSKPLEEKAHQALAVLEAANQPAKHEEFYDNLDQQYKMIGIEKTESFRKLEAQSKDLTRKAVGLDKFRANIDAVRAQMNQTKKAMESRIRTDQRAH